jgi:hypothetical protein
VKLVATTEEDEMATMQRAYTDEDLPRLLSLIESADSVELKVTISGDQQQSAVAALGLDPLDAQIRQVFFFDTPDLALSRAGVVVRARRVQKRHDDSVIKLRPVDPAALPKDVRRSAAFGVEVDALPGGFVCSGTMKATLGADAVRGSVLGDRPLRKLFSKEQRALYAHHAPDGIALDHLRVLGPVFVLKLKRLLEGFEYPLVAELWLYPDGSRIFELSTKCPPSEAFQAAAEARGLLAGRGIDLSGEQETKTRKALEFFTGRPEAA